MNRCAAAQAAAMRPGASVVGAAIGAMLLLLTHALLLGPAAAQGAPGVVYTMTNATAGNAVVVYQRAADGTLTLAGMVPTGGTGTGGGLENQGGLILTSDNRWLFAVNAGSQEVSAFAVGPQGLTLVDRVPSGGERPVSLTAHGNQLYVLNAGGVNNITGFTISDRGMLTPLPGSARRLSADSTRPAQVEFSPDGSLLVVTERGTDRIDIYPVSRDGIAGSRPLDMALSADSRYLYVLNRGPGAVMGFRVEGNGSLTSLNSVAGLPAGANGLVAR